MNSIVPKVSVVLPVYNERDTIQGLIRELVQALKETGETFEIILIEDGSNDGTPDIIKELITEYPEIVKVVAHPYNKGNGASIKSGIRKASGEFVVCMDADGQHNPHDIKRLLPYIETYDLVVGTRTGNYNGAWYRNLANRLYNALASWLTDFPVEDLTSGLRLFRAGIVKKYVQLFPARFSYPTTSTLIFLKGGYNVKYVPVNIRPRQGGQSKIRIFNDGWRFIVIIFKIIVLFEPLRVFLPISVVSFILAILSTAYSTWSIKSLFIPNSSVILFVLGVIVLLMGLISEQITTMQISSHTDD